jgi:hypothetical protein
MTVIRDAEITIRYRVDKSGLQGADMAPQAHAESLERISKASQTAAVEQIALARATSNANVVIGQAAATTDTFGAKANESFTVAGRGAMQFSRGLALMAAAGGDSTQKMLQDILLLEAATQLGTGAANIARYAENWGGLGLAVAGTGIALAGVVLGSEQFNAITEKGIKLNEEFAKSMESRADSYASARAAEEKNQAQAEQQRTRDEKDPIAKAQDEDEELKSIAERRAQRDVELGNRQQRINEESAKAALANKVVESTSESGATPTGMAERIIEHGWLGGIGSAITDIGRRLGSGVGIDTAETEGQRHEAAATELNRARGTIKEQNKERTRILELEQQDAQREYEIYKSRQDEAIRRHDANLSYGERAREQAAEVQFRQHLYKEAATTGGYDAGRFVDAANQHMSFNEARMASDPTLKGIDDQARKTLDSVRTLLLNLNSQLEYLKAANQGK